MFLSYVVVAIAAVQFTPALAQYRDVDPCSPSPCGPNTQCSVNSGGAAICRCLPGYFPKPDTITGCGPQCTSDYECRSHERCNGNECVSACSPSPCGVNAECEAYNHRAICKCFRGYVGDPFHQCRQDSPISRAIISSPNTQVISPFARVALNPCSPSPCGTNAQCTVNGDRPVCTCLPGYQGNPAVHCRRGECSSNSECPSHQVCNNFNCVNPCSNACGSNANCDVRNHIPVCTCPPGYTGDPVRSCRRNDYCNPSPCGVNTKCRVENDRAVCSCLPTFIGDPIQGCRHECDRDTDCGASQACINFKCKNPCVGACGQYATCEVQNHVAVCRCPPDYLGDPATRCFPECTSHAECPGNLACIGLKCADPCKGACGRNAECRVDRSNHKAICSCPKGYTGHPFDECRPFTPQDLCSPNPCGANAVCTPGYDNSGRDRPVCTCPPGYIGDALRACTRGECTTDAECGLSRSCNNFQCVNPCANACGVNANCEVRNHGAICSCPRGFTGDPFTQCNADPTRGKRENKVEKKDTPKEE